MSLSVFVYPWLEFPGKLGSNSLGSECDQELPAYRRSCSEHTETEDYGDRFHSHECFSILLFPLA